MKKALVITTLGKTTVIDLSTKSLEQLQEAVGGHNQFGQAVGGLVQAIDLDADLTMWCNEEGKLYGLPHNPFGQALWEQVYGRTDYIVGDIVLTGGADDEGETIGLTDEQVAEIMKTVMSVLEFISARMLVI